MPRILLYVVEEHSGIVIRIQSIVLYYKRVYNYNGSTAIENHSLHA
jgi:hypothetical protein